MKNLHKKGSHTLPLEGEGSGASPPPLTWQAEPWCDAGRKHPLQPECPFGCLHPNAPFSPPGCSTLCVWLCEGCSSQAAAGVTEQSLMGPK